jgi:hypothetical protein
LSTKKALKSHFHLNFSRFKPSNLFCSIGWTLIAWNYYVVCELDAVWMAVDTAFAKQITELEHFLMGF